MFIDSILDQLLRPFRQLWEKWMRVRSIKGGIEGDVRRVKMLGYQAQSYQQQVAQVPNQIQQGWNSAQQKVAGGQPQAQAKKKMSWFPWSKKTCPRCNNKLHKSWDQCPYCGQNQNEQPPQMAVPTPPPTPVANPPSPQRTVMYDPGAAPPVAQTGPGDIVAWLVPLEGPQAGVPMQFRGRVLIGTAEGCEFRLPDVSISSRHAEIAPAGGQSFRLTDLGSTNGSYVNGKRVTSVTLADNDDIRLGRTSFRFKYAVT